MWSSVRALLFAALLCSTAANAEIFVYPRHAGKVQVRHFPLKWKYTDLKPSNDGGGVRLFFYDREEKVAERGAAGVQDAWRYLEGEFQYTPQKRFEYFIYSSYPEFLQSNLFPLQEGVLGVTSPLDLKLTLPFLGDDRLFEEVGTHELAHEFTIQKVESLAEKVKAADPLDQMPLWFIEGLAEYYAKRGMDPEAELLVRDLILNPDAQHDYVFTDFFSDGPLNFLWIYKFGQARCAFLTETYGKDFLQRILDGSSRLSHGGPSRVSDFPELLEKLSGDKREVIASKFEAWAKRGASKTFLAGSQDPSSFELLTGFPRDVDDLASSPTGDAIAIRTFDPYTGQARLLLVDPRGASQSKLVAADSLPGFESLHPMFGRNFDLTGDEIAFVAEAGGRDVLHVRKYEHKAKPLTKEERDWAKPIGQGDLPVLPLDEWDVDFKLGDERQYRLERERIVAILSTTLSPDGKRIAFVGLDENGVRDLYVLTPNDSDYSVERLTNDEFAERQVTWGPQGIVFSSDNTKDRRFNLFRVDPDHPAPPERLTAEARDEMDPRALADGRLYFTAWENARLEVHELREGQIIRRTDVSSGLFDLAPGPSGGLQSLILYRGQRIPVRIKPSLLEQERDSKPAGAGEPGEELSRVPLADSTPYRPTSIRNWQLGPTMAFLGGSSYGVAGSVISSATDRLRNHQLILQATLYGTWDLFDGLLLYLNQERRVTWGVGAFQELRFRSDPSLPDLPFGFTSGQRYSGGLLTARYPLSTFARVETDLAVGAMSTFLLNDQKNLLSDPTLNGVGDVLPEWKARNAGAPLVVETTLRLGHDTIRYHALAGPMAGHSVLAEGTLGYEPWRQETYSNLRLDASQYVPIVGRLRLALLGGVGATFGDAMVAREFYLSSADTLRGVPFGNTVWLIGREFLYSTAELRVPLDALIRIAFLNRVEAVAGFDAGGVGDGVDGIWNRRVVDFATGLNLGLGPLLARIQIARPFDTGASFGLPVHAGTWVPQFSLRVVGLEGFLGFGPRTSGAADPRGFPSRAM